MFKEELMGRALALARVHNPAPNPRVGAVVVKDGRIFGEGAHLRPGEPHAEVNALREAAAATKGADLYVTLEPCCHSGGGKRTPPCTDLIIKSGIKRVFVSSTDPNPEVSGKGLSALEGAGIRVECGIRKAEERMLNREYHHFCRTGRPWIHLKQAVSLDGFIAAEGGVRTRLSCGEALNRVHRLRAARQAVLCGGSTVIIDDPELTVRRAGGISPVRLILEGRNEIPETAGVFNTTSVQTILYTSSKNSSRLERLRAAVVQIVQIDPVGKGGIDALLSDAASRGIISILAEAGGKLSAALLSAGLVNELSIFYSPVMLGSGLPMSGSAAIDLRSHRWTASPPEVAGSDVIMNWHSAEVS
jgi:diaminohydroxyphosphoribosylaminopyrimidine deaminase/5-amino-6-(5-phosphoribosylamino)uracil reductase